MPAPDPEPVYIDEHHQRISEFAADYLDDDEERDNFVNDLMERRGYTRIESWGPPEDPEPDDGGRRAPARQRQQRGGQAGGQGGQGGGQPRRGRYFR